jgi:hypothetical protein
MSRLALQAVSFLLKVVHVLYFQGFALQLTPAYLEVGTLLELSTSRCQGVYWSEALTSLL